MADDDNGDTQQRPARASRPSGASLIAELLSAQEAASPPPPPPPHPTDALGARRPDRERREGSKTGLVVGVVALALLLGGGLGVYLASQGVGMTSRAKFVAKADKLCGAANGPVTALAKPSSYPELATAAGTLVTATETQLGGLRALKLPAGADGSRAGDVLTAMAETNHAGRSLQDAANRKDDAATAAATQQVRTAATKALTTATELGMAACATGAQPGVDAVVAGASGVVKTAFVANADTLCRATARALEGVREPRNDPRDLGRYLGATLQIVEKLVADIKALAVPPGDEATIAETTRALESMTAKWREARDAATANDRSRFLAIDGEMTILSTAADAKLDAYGLATCGSNFGGR